MLSLIIATLAAIAFCRGVLARHPKKAGWRRVAAALAAAFAATLGPGLALGQVFARGIVPALPADGLLMSHYAACDLGWRILTVVIELVLVFGLYRRFFAPPPAGTAPRR